MANDRDERLKGAEKRMTDLAKRNGYEDGKARKMARDAVEKADAVKKKLGHW